MATTKGRPKTKTIETSARITALERRVDTLERDIRSILIRLNNTERGGRP